jgi:serine/threonine-protein kinase
MTQEDTPTAERVNGQQTDEYVAVSRLMARLSDRYAVDRKLGSGGTGVVYLARDVKLGRPVAIKVLHPKITSRIGVETFKREVRLTAALQHPHILQVLDSGCVDGMCYYITPFLAEGSLHDLIERDGRLAPDTAVRIAVDVLHALEFAHNQGIVHCDLKPENILLSNGHAILADFGIARSAGGGSVRDKDHISGSPAYMSPEQAAGESRLDGRSDVFSLACVLYEMLAGKPAYTGPHALAVIAKRFQGPAPSVSKECPSAPRGIAFAISRALSVDPNDRFAGASSFAAALLRAANAHTTFWRRGFRRSGLGRTVARLTRSAIFLLAIFLPG